MKIVLIMTDNMNRSIVVGPFESVDDAESFGKDVTPTDSLELTAVVNTICTPDEYLAVDDLNDLEITLEPDVKYPCGLCGDPVTDSTLSVHACCGCGFRDRDLDGRRFVCPNCNPLGRVV